MAVLLTDVWPEGSTLLCGGTTGETHGIKMPLPFARGEGAAHTHTHGSWILHPCFRSALADLTRERSREARNALRTALRLR